MIKLHDLWPVSGPASSGLCQGEKVTLFENEPQCFPSLVYIVWWMCWSATTIIHTSSYTIALLQVTHTHTHTCILTRVAYRHTCIDIRDTRTLWDYTTQHSTNPTRHKYMWPTGRFHSPQKLYRWGGNTAARRPWMFLFSSQVTHK